MNKLKNVQDDEDGQDDDEEGDEIDDDEIDDVLKHFSISIQKFYEFHSFIDDIGVANRYCLIFARLLFNSIVILTFRTRMISYRRTQITRRPKSGLELNNKNNQVSVGIRNRVFGTIFYKFHATISRFRQILHNFHDFFPDI